MKEELEFDDFAFTVHTFIFRLIIVDFKGKRIVNMGVICFLLSPLEASYRHAFKIKASQNLFEVFLGGGDHS